MSFFVLTPEVRYVLDRIAEGYHFRTDLSGRHVEARGRGMPRSVDEHAFDLALTHGLVTEKDRTEHCIEYAGTKLADAIYDRIYGVDLATLVVPD